MTYVKTWKDWLGEFPVGEAMTTLDVRVAMLREIDDLREALEKAQQERDKHFYKLTRVRQEVSGVVIERDVALAKLAELNLQYISDFGQLQEKEPESTLSWNGFNVHGDKKSMGEVLRLVERCASLEQYLKVGTTSTEDAVNHAVKMTEDYIAKNVAENNLPPQQKELT